MLLSIMNVLDSAKIFVPEKLGTSSNTLYKVIFFFTFKFYFYF